MTPLQFLRLRRLLCHLHHLRRTRAPAPPPRQVLHRLEVPAVDILRVKVQGVAVVLNREDARKGTRRKDTVVVAVAAVAHRGPLRIRGRRTEADPGAAEKMKNVPPAIGGDEEVTEDDRNRLQ